ncbi:MAG: hypothetical protein IH624_01530 [Phycisphaerae bacterium]|nr:hypothetical protein [Phycisphaerae bacterium]
MDEERLEEMARDPRFIKGVYNYCDRWCERCGFTGRCLNYALCGEEFAEKDEQEQWQVLGRLMRQTASMVQRDAKEHGIDLEALDAADETDDLPEGDASEQPCCSQAKRYMEAASAWFDAADELFKGQQDALYEAVRLELPETTPEQTAQAVNAAVETIRWYQHQIYIKLMRAHRKTTPPADPADEMLDDANGSAKVALIGMDRSIHAWDMLYRILAEEQDSILDILVQLGRLRRSVEAVFPAARAFIRPGLDELPSDEA